MARWLAQEKQPISEQWIGATRLYQYTAWEVTSRQIVNELDAHFVDVAQLEGYRLTPSEEAWQPGTTTTIELFWRPLGQTAESLKIFVHLLGPAKADGSVLWTQDDQFPQGGRISSQDWPPGELVRKKKRCVYAATGLRAYLDLFFNIERLFSVETDRYLG